MELRVVSQNHIELFRLTGNFGDHLVQPAQVFAHLGQGVPAHGSGL